MVRLTIFLMLTIGLPVKVLAEVPMDSTAKLRFQELADKLRLKRPKEDEYEIRIWNKQGLIFGTAQMLYVLNKRAKSLTATKYIINSDKIGFRSSIELKPQTPATLDLWERLVQHSILALPSEDAIYNKLHPPPQKDSTWTVVETDGSVSVKAKKIESSVWILDGESYYFEIFSSTGYQGYWYSNPREYIRYKPNIAELQNVVSILNEVVMLFRSKHR